MPFPRKREKKTGGPGSASSRARIDKFMQQVEEQRKGAAPTPADSANGVPPIDAAPQSREEC